MEAEGGGGWCNDGGSGALRPRIVLFGDSITQQSFRPGGWGAALADCYCRKADVVLRGYSGYNTKWALFQLDKIFSPKLEPPPVAVTIFFGANDAALPERSNGYQHVPIPEYKKNLHQIISHLKAVSEFTRIILITPPPVDEKGRRAFARAMYGDMAEELPERTNQMSGEYASACKAVAHEAGLPVIDLWTTFQQNGSWQELYLSDGLHLTPAGNAVVFEELVKALNGIGLAESEMQLDFPLHSSINAENPELTFKAHQRSLQRAAMALLLQCGTSCSISKTISFNGLKSGHNGRNCSLSFVSFRKSQRMKNAHKVRAFFNIHEEPIVKEALKEPIAFLGGVFAGLLRLDLEEEPLKGWVERTAEAAGINLEKESDAKEEEGPEEILIE